MTRKELAKSAYVSERFLAQLETGHGNISIIRLRRIAHAMGMGVERLAQEKEWRMCLRWRELWRYLEKLNAGSSGAPRAGDAARRNLGRGAWKRGEGGLRWWDMRGAVEVHTGRAACGADWCAVLLNWNRRIEQESGVKLSAVFDLYGPAGFHRLERERWSACWRRMNDLCWRQAEAL